MEGSWHYFPMQRCICLLQLDCKDQGRSFQQGWISFSDRLICNMNRVCFVFWVLHTMSTIILKSWTVLHCLSTNILTIFITFRIGNQCFHVHVMFIFAEFNRPKRLIVFINPHSGKERGPKLYQNKVAPLFELAGITTDVVGECQSCVSQQLRAVFPHLTSFIHHLWPQGAQCACTRKLMTVSVLCVDWGNFSFPVRVHWGIYIPWRIAHTFKLI